MSSWAAVAKVCALGLAAWAVILYLAWKVFT